MGQLDMVADRTIRPTVQPLIEGPSNMAALRIDVDALRRRNLWQPRALVKTTPGGTLTRSHESAEVAI